jgi:hypothetical protein
VICDELGYWPQVETLAAAKTRLPRRLHDSLSAAVQACLNCGHARTPRKREPEKHFEWAVRHQIRGKDRETNARGESYTEIAVSGLMVSDEDLLEKLTCLVKAEVLPIKKLVGLATRRGRPPAR